VNCVVGGSSSRFRAARLLRIRLAISTFVMLPLSIACSICHATASYEYNLQIIKDSRLNPRIHDLGAYR
jgi:hypothetical protein